MEIHFYHQWDESTKKKNQSVSSFATGPEARHLNIVYIMASLVAICVFSYLIFSNHSGQADLEEIGAVAKTEEVFYTVRGGDTLWSIAARYYPELSTMEAIRLIQQRNNFEGATIHAGQTILLP